MQYLDTIEEIVDEDENKPPIRKRRKWFKKVGCLQIVAGIIIITVAIIAGGLLIPIVVGGYLIANGLVNSLIKIDC